MADIAGEEDWDSEIEIKEVEEDSSEEVISENHEIREETVLKDLNTNALQCGDQV